VEFVKRNLLALTGSLAAILFFFLGNSYLLFPSIPASRQHHPVMFLLSIADLILFVGLLALALKTKVKAGLVGFGMIAVFALSLVLVIASAGNGFWPFLLFAGIWVFLFITIVGILVYLSNRVRVQKNVTQAPTGQPKSTIDETRVDNRPRYTEDDRAYGDRDYRDRPAGNLYGTHRQTSSWDPEADDRNYNPYGRRDDDRDSRPRRRGDWSGMSDSAEPRSRRDRRPEPEIDDRRGTRQDPRSRRTPRPGATRTANGVSGSEAAQGSTYRDQPSARQGGEQRRQQPQRRRSGSPFPGTSDRSRGRRSDRDS
jgi:hypothetical protein